MRLFPNITALTLVLCLTAGVAAHAEILPQRKPEARPENPIKASAALDAPATQDGTKTGLAAKAETKTDAAPLPAATAGEIKEGDVPLTPAGADAEGAEFAADAQKSLEAEADLPDYPSGAIKSTGKPATYTTGESDTLLDVARFFDFGYVELRAANSALDPWAPEPGTEIVLPGFDLLPRAPQKGIVVNLSEMRLYYFKDEGRDPISVPIGIGREGLQTPTGETTVIRKQAGPTWFPTERMLEEKPYLPKSVPPGPANPLGTHALYLGWPTFLIHGANKPWSIGRRVSSGCMRLYPDDIKKIFDMVPVGTKVTVVDQPVKLAWLKEGLYLEVHPAKVQSYELENGDIETPLPVTDKMRAFITKEAGAAASALDWKLIEAAFLERKGVPVMIVPVLGPKKEDAPPMQTGKTKSLPAGEFENRI